MIGEENLDVRTVTLGVNLNRCAGQDGAASRLGSVAQWCLDTGSAALLRPVAGPLAEHFAREVLGQAIDIEYLQHGDRFGWLALELAAGAPQRAAPAAAPADFPRVDSAEQRARDADRLGILNEELRNEQQKLADLRKEFNNGEPERHGDERNYAKYQERVAQMRDSISRSEKNIEALKREIATIR